VADNAGTVLNENDADEERGSPRHGYQGDRGRAPERRTAPASLTIAVSRQAGSRGNTIGSRVGQKLGWPVYNHELLEAMAHDGPLRQSIIDDSDTEALHWVEARLEHLLSSGQLAGDASVISLARTVLTLGYRGEVVLIGRGAGHILPHSSTLHVRIMAPLADRIAYMGQWLRLTQGEAAEQVRRRDRHRADFLSAHFKRDPQDADHYDIILNSGLLGEELCAEVIIRAARVRLTAATSSIPAA
jgi:cytidylate kinase